MTKMQNEEFSTSVLWKVWKTEWKNRAKVEKLREMGENVREVFHSFHNLYVENFFFRKCVFLHERGLTALFYH